MQINKRTILYFILIFLFVTLTGVLLRNKLGDDEYIIFQYVKNISTGHGWTFNQGMTINGCTSVLYPLLLACFALLGFNIVSTALWLSLFFLAGCGIVVYFLLKQNGYPKAAYLAPFLIIVRVISLWSLGLETTMALCLSFLSIYFYFQKRYTLTTALLALTVLTRPDTMLLAGVLFFHFLFTTRKIPWQQLLLFILLLLPWGIFSWVTFKSLFPNTLYSKIIQGLLENLPLWQRISLRVLDPMPVGFIEPLHFKQFFIGVFILLVLGGLLKIFFEKRDVLSGNNKYKLLVILLLWGVLHMALYIYFRIPVGYRWHMAPVAGIYCILAAMSIESLTSFLKNPFRVFVIILLFGLFCIPEIIVYTTFVTHDWKHRNRTTFYLEAGNWFRENTPPSTTIGAYEVGVLGYFSNRTIIDMAGLVTPGVSRHVFLNDPYWPIRYYRPDYFIRFSPPIRGYDFAIPDTWQEQAYRPEKAIRFSDTTVTLVIYKKINDSVIPQADDYRLALMSSIEKSEYDKVKSLLEIGADVNCVYPNGTTPLFQATRKGDLKMVQLLLNKGVQVNQKNDVGSTALIDAANNGYRKIVGILLANGADVNAKTNSGWTALLGAVLNGNSETVKLLLNKGADPNAANNDGNSPLGVAAFNGYTEIVKQLLTHGADINVKNKGGGTPLRSAIWKGHSDIVQILKQAGEKE